MSIWTITTVGHSHTAETPDSVSAWAAAYDAAGALVREGARQRITLVVDGVRVAISPADTGNDNDIRETLEVLEFARNDSINSLQRAV